MVLLDVSIVLPALNEEKSIGQSIENIKKILSKNNIGFEIIVVDSDSKDKTAVIAKEFGAKVINEPRRGYGNALRRGFSEAEGKYIIIYDPDGSYDVNTLPLMINKLKEGYDYVNGNRFAKLTYKSMSLRNRIGNKIINLMGNFFFKVKGKDMLSGFKGFRIESLKKLDLHAKRWDLNIEIHAKIKKNHLKFAEIPTTYFPRIGESKLSGTNAAWYNFRYMLMYSPNFMFIYPSMIFILISIFVASNILMRPSLGNISLIFSSIIFIIGLQMFLFGIMSKTFLFKKGFEKKSLLSELGSNLTLEKGIGIGLILFTISFVIFFTILIKWLNADRILQLIDIKFGIMSFTLLMVSISIVTYSFVNQIINEE